MTFTLPNSGSGVDSGPEFSLDITPNLVGGSVKPAHQRGHFSDLFIGELDSGQIVALKRPRMREVASPDIIRVCRQRGHRSVRTHIGLFIAIPP